MPDSSTILHKRNPNSGAVPTLTSLSAGELAINTFDGKLFTKTTKNAVVSFTNDYEVPFTLDPALSGAIPQYGNNTISQSFANVLGGYNNDVSGAASTTVNGEDNDIAGDLAFIGSGYKNKITVDGDYSAILAGSNNLISHQNSFVIGSNLSSHAADFTYVNNISASGALYGNGSGLTDVTSIIMTAQVKNVDSVTLTRGTVVYTFGATGDVMSVKRASSAGDPTSSKTLGLINETITPNGIGSVTLAGRMDHLALPSPYADGDVLWLGNTPGTFTRTKPVAPEHGVYLGVVERANVGNGIIYVKVQNGYELNELHDVLINGVQSGDVLQRNSANTLWISAPLSSSNWNSVYTNVRANSASWGTGGTAQSLSFNEATKDLTLSFGNTVSLSALGSATGDYLPLSGGTLTGTIAGDLSATGSFYGDGSKLTGIIAGDTVATTLVRSNSANWDSVYSNVKTTSANWNYAYSNQANYLPLSGGTVTGITQFNNNLTVYGNISATGTSYFSNTIYATTSALSVVNMGNTGPALFIGNNGTGDIASFYDLDQNIEILHVGGSNGTFPNVGIKTSTPNETFTVNGTISASSVVYAQNGNSAQWNAAYTTMSSLSANWQTTFQASSAYVSSNPAGITGASALTKLIQITQAGYNSITPASDTLYVIVG